MSSKRYPQDSELRARFLTTSNELPTNQLHAKRIRLIETEHLSFVKFLRDILDDGPAKTRLLEGCEAVKRHVAAAVCNPAEEMPAAILPFPGVPAGPPATVATDPVPDAPAPLPAVPATGGTHLFAPPPSGSGIQLFQDPPEGTGLG